ncbi:MAG: hypothetical protein M3Y86_13245, partial [Verrucomicrobiota bacterium]|nr:hypothetical protein [Verrucomicrobiota bacterium]
RPYLISWEKDEIVLRPAALTKGENSDPVASMRLHRGDTFALQLPAALIADPPAQWAFWPSGVCEPATVKFKGSHGSWTANYSALTARPELATYVAQ